MQVSLAQRLRFAKFGAVLGLLASCAIADPPPAVAPSQPLPPVDPQVDAILTRLEARTVTDLKARLVWEIQHDVQMNADNPEVITRKGEISYKDARPVPKFYVKFTERVSGGRKQKQEEEHLFDGRWYTELNSAAKTVTRREMRRADDPRNPFKLGDGGTFPVPFGQEKQEILREFEVRLEPAGSGDPKNTDHLVLTPHKWSRMSDDYQSLDFWVQRGGAEDGLPVKVRMAKLDGNGRLDSYVTVTFGEAKLDRGLSDNVFRINTPLGYQLIEEPLVSDPTNAPPK